MKPLRVGLLTTLERNLGDDFIREGLLQAMESVAGNRAIQPVAVDKHLPFTAYPRRHPLRWFYSPTFNRLPRALRRGPGWAARHLWRLGFSRFDGCDLILQCGTPVIWENCRQAEWAEPIWSRIFGRLSSRLPVLNLGAGSCYPCERAPTTLAGNPDEAYVRLMLRTARLTTVRDRLSQDLFATMGHDVRRLACPALLIAQRYALPAPPSRKVLINYMAGAGHYDWGQGVDAMRWEQTMRALVAQLRQDGWRPTMLCHSPAEAELAARIWPDLPQLRPHSSADYFGGLGDAAFGLFNRLHASVAVAGLGVPSICVGTDTRIQMVETLGLPAFFAKEADLDRMRAAIRKLVATREEESRRLLALRAAAFSAYAEILRPWLPLGRSATANRLGTGKAGALQAS